MKCYETNYPFQSGKNLEKLKKKYMMMRMKQLEKVRVRGDYAQFFKLSYARSEASRTMFCFSKIL